MLGIEQPSGYTQTVLPWLVIIIAMMVAPQNPMGTQPTVWNDPDGTPELRTQLLWDIRQQQSPGDIHIMDALRTPAGRQVLNRLLPCAN